MCLLMLFAKIKFSRKFPNLQYLEIITLDTSKYTMDHSDLRVSVFMGKSHWPTIPCLGPNCLHRLSCQQMTIVGKHFNRVGSKKWLCITVKD